MFHLDFCDENPDVQFIKIPNVAMKRLISNKNIQKLTIFSPAEAGITGRSLLCRSGHSSISQSVAEEKFDFGNFMACNFVRPCYALRRQF
jgi:hypothetical protein